MSMTSKKKNQILITVWLVIICLSVIGLFAFDINGGGTNEYLNPRVILMSIFITISATVLSLAFGMALGYILFIKAYGKPKFENALKNIRSFFTLLPTSTWLIFCFYILFGGNANIAYPAGIFALSICMAATVTGEFSGAVGQVTAGEKEAAISMGYSDKQILKNILLPQAIPNVLSNMSTNVRFHVKDTSLLGMIYVADLQYVADHIQTEAYIPAIPIISVAISYVVLGYTFSEIMLYIKNHLHYGNRTKEEILARALRGQV